MAPKTPQNKKTTIKSNAKAIELAGSAAINYGEVQSEEVEVLKSIYMDDFEEVEIKSAWNKSTDRSFKLTLRAFSDEQSTVTLSIHLTATYPKTAPLLNVQGLNNYHERTQKRIRNILRDRPKELLGEVMIYAIATDVQDALEDAVQARQQGTLPSLEEERASAEEVAATNAKQAEEAETRDLQAAREEEDRVLKQMVDEELSRREKRTPAKVVIDDLAKATSVDDADIVAFGQAGSMQVESDDVRFSRVTVVSVLSQEGNGKIYLAKPSVAGNVQCPLVAIKRLTIQKKRDEVMELESILTSAQKLRHQGLLSIFTYRIDKVDELKSELVLCTQHSDRGTLQELMELSNLHVSKCRQFAVDLLVALDYLHHNGLAHGNLDATRVGLTGSPSPSPKLVDFGYPWSLGGEKELPTKWQIPETGITTTAMRQRSDVWYFGGIAVQMFLGLETLRDYASPQALLDKLDLSDSFDDFVRNMFALDPKRRPSAFDLLPSEFLRGDDPPLGDVPLATRRDPRRASGSASAGLASPMDRRSRHNSSSALEHMSRYTTDFTEMGRLGKGGYGEVVKARNKLDGGVYAVKKIKQTPQLLSQVISEVMLLNRLNHPYVVRYFTTWVEDEVSGAVIEDSTTDEGTGMDTIEEENTSDGPRTDFGFESKGGLDFVSSSGYGEVVFGEDSDEEAIYEETEDLEDGESAIQNGLPRLTSSDKSIVGAPSLRRSRSDSRRAPSVLYIQMEYCERLTLRDVIRKTLTADDAWRYVRQITEGLAHVHSHGIIHRDLKPDNVFLDNADNPKIGDFGLATTTQFHIPTQVAIMSGGTSGDMTKSVGTTLYVAPELRSTSSGTYNDKVDMYSLGIIFYEMCQPFSTAMERITELEDVRKRDHELPPAFQSTGDKSAQGRFISCLISHKPSERPKATELLRSEMLPLKIEDETIRQALNGLSDARSPYHQKMMSALFSHDSAGTSKIKALAWDARIPANSEDASRVRLRGVAREALEAVFRRHGAEEFRRETIFPRSAYYTNPNVVQLLNAGGNLVQLPYDLTLPNARHLAHQISDLRCTYTFGSAYREAFTGGPPRVHEEVDFDIMNDVRNDDAQMDEAEILKVTDEAIKEMPLFASSNTVSFHVNHSILLNAVLEHCRVPAEQQLGVKEIVSRLGFHQYIWSKCRVELRQFGLPDTVLDDLQQFDFRDTPAKAYARLLMLTESASARVRKRVDAGISALKEVVRLTALFNIQSKIYLTPLGSLNAKFYEDGMLFQCVLERKSNRIVIAAGGRYDSLIRALRPVEPRAKPQGAVCVSIGLDAIVTNMAKSSEGSSKKMYLKHQGPEQPTTKRCDVLVVASGTDAVHDAGIRILTSLWANDISAELDTSRTTKDREHSYIVTVRHEASSAVRFSCTGSDSDEVDVPIAALVSHLHQELRDRESTKSKQPLLLRQASQQDTERKSNVHVLIARHGSKKTNKYQIVNEAQDQWSKKLDAAKSAQILAVETRDEVVDLVHGTRFSDAESWRKAVQTVPLNDRQYVQQIQDVLISWRRKWQEGDGMREACVFNFRTQYCVYYDLGL